MGIIVVFSDGKAEHVPNAERWERDRVLTATGSADGDWILLGSNDQVVARFGSEHVRGCKKADNSPRDLLRGQREGRSL